MKRISSTSNCAVTGCYVEGPHEHGTSGGNFHDKINLSETEMLFDCIEKVMAFFEKQGEPRKAVAWFETENPNLGGIKPIHMVSHDRIDKLHKFIVGSLAENEP